MQRSLGILCAVNGDLETATKKLQITALIRTELLGPSHSLTRAVLHELTTLAKQTSIEFHTSKMFHGESTVE
jgi:hypothetical protein